MFYFYFYLYFLSSREVPRFKRLALLHHSAIILLSICFVTTSRYLYSFIFITLFNKLCDDDDDDVNMFFMCPYFSFFEDISLRPSEAECQAN